MQTIHARHALLPDGWGTNIAVTVDGDGRIASIGPSDQPCHGILLPAPGNLHSHAFQRAMAGLSEARGPDPRDTFWTWRQIMYRFLDHLTPDDVQAIAAQVQMEMLEAGYAAVGEFHYLHHRPDGAPYDHIGEMSERIVAAAQDTGIGLTLLPVLYEQGGCDGRPLGPGQRRFGNDPDQFGKLLDAVRGHLAPLADSTLGVAPHSLRAVPRDHLAFIPQMTDGPLHMHLAEQLPEVDEVQAAYGARPVEWALENLPLDARWCLIHLTQMSDAETARLARTGAVAGLCPLTEASLGDGIFDGPGWLADKGSFGIGSDSNIRITLAGELQQLEYSQRLRDHARALLATPDRSTGRILYQSAATGAATAMGRDSADISPGKLADLVLLEDSAADFAFRRGDSLLDTWIFASPGAVSDVWSAGRHMVQDGRHIRRQAIAAQFAATLKRLADAL